MIVDSTNQRMVRCATFGSYQAATAYAKEHKIDSHPSPSNQAPLRWTLVWLEPEDPKEALS